MKLRYELDGDPIAEYTDLIYVEEEKKFLLSGSSSETLEYFPILDLDPEYNPNDFSIELLKNDDSTENSIFTVKVRSDESWKRIGWVFPVQALLSREHTQAENRYFLKYAYIATYILLNRMERHVDIGDNSFPQELMLEDLYDSDINILVIDHNNCKLVNDFCLDNYAIGLCQYGYSWTGKINRTLPLPESIENQPGHIKIQRISNEIKNREIINMLFKEQLTNELPSLLMFYYSYQIIEILIQEIFENEFGQLLSSISTDAEKLFDVRDDVNKISGENYRVKRLFHDCTNQVDGTSLNELNDECLNLLNYFGRKTSQDVAGNLYKVRCLLVHKMYTISTVDIQKRNDINEMLKRINISLLLVLQNMLFTFHKV